LWQNLFVEPHYSENPIRQGKMMEMFTGLPAAQVLNEAAITVDNIEVAQFVLARRPRRGAG
jgi:hypothetical protein